MTMLVAPISTRNCFGQLLNSMGLVGEAVEIGTHRGEFAANFLNNWKGWRLTCVDPWERQPASYAEQAKHLWGGGNRSDDRREAELCLAIHGERVRLWQGLSADAALEFPVNRLDFAYLDGDHKPPCVEQDIYLWWERVRPGGVLAGHDFVCPGPPGREDDWGRFIQPAVLKFAERRRVNVNLVVEENGLPWSYYLVKPA